MNIQYKENTDGKRFAEIQFRPREADDADKFLSLIEEGGYKYSFENEIINIEVADQKEYTYIENLYKEYYDFDWIAYIENAGLKDAADKWLSDKLTDQGLYEKCKQDVDLYIILDNEGNNTEEIKEFMDNVSGSSDAYNNAVSEFFQIINSKI